MGILIDGKALAAQLRGEIREQAEKFRKQRGKDIGLAVILVGEDPASQVYVRNKIKACEEVGVKSFSYHLPAETTEQQLVSLIDELVESENVHGILVQLPLPKHLNERAVLAHIPPVKDVDGFCAENVGNLAMNRTTIVACTPFGVMKMLEKYGIDLKGKNAVVLGRSNIVGKPMMCMLSSRGVDATVTLCHSRTANLTDELKRADLIVAAIGKPEFVRGDMVKEGAVVIDVGINRVVDSSRPKGYRLTGDVAFEEVAPKASAITPVPGGVGPMTIAMLMRNTLRGMERIMELR